MEEGSMVIDSVVMPGAKIGKNVVIERAIVGSEMVIEDGTIIRPEKNVDDVVLIAEGNRKGDEMNGRKNVRNY